MKAADALKLLQENANTDYDMVLPSNGEIIKMKPLSLEMYKNITKTGFQKPGKLSEELIKTISELSHGKLNEENLIEYDKLAILIMLKNNNERKTDFSVSFECDNLDCGRIIKHSYDCTRIYNKERKFGPDNYVVDDANIGSKVTIKLGEPTVKDNILFDKFVKERLATIIDALDRKTFQIYISAYENYMLFIKGIEIDSQEVEDFKTMDILERIKFLSNFNHGIIDTEKINKFTANMFNNLRVTQKCQHCEEITSKIISPTDFLVI